MTGKTLAELKESRERLGIYCGDTRCWHRAMLDTDALIARLGAGHGAMHDDLVGLFYCTKCRAAGRPDRNIGFSLHQDYAWIHEKHTGWRR